MQENLLYLESELMELEAALDAMDEEDRANDGPERIPLLAMGRSWKLIKKMANDGNGAALKRQELILLVREKCKEYGTQFLEYAHPLRWG